MAKDDRKPVAPWLRLLALTAYLVPVMSAAALWAARALRPGLLLAIALLAVAAVSSFRPAWLEARWRRIAVNVVGVAACLVLVAPWLLALDIDTSWLTLSALLFTVLAVAGIGMPPSRRLVLAGCGTFLTSFWMLLATMMTVQQSESLEPRPIVSEALVDDCASPGRHYRMMVDRDERTGIVGLPVNGRSEVYSLDPLRRMDEGDLGFARFCELPDRAGYVAADWMTGPVLLDPDLQVVGGATLAWAGDTDSYRFKGIACSPERAKVFLARDNGELLILSYPDFRTLDTTVCSTHPRTGCDDCEIVQDFMGIEGRDFALASQYDGSLVAFDLDGRFPVWQVRVSQVASLSNLVVSTDGRAVFVVSLVLGQMYRVDLDTREVQAVMRLGTGSRYMARLGNRDLLVVSNYFTGRIVLVDPVEQRILATLSAGPRIQWIHPLRDGRRFVVPHAFGVSIYDAELALQGSLHEDGSFRFPTDVLFRGRFWSEDLPRLFPGSPGSGSAH
jgi:hypothetical protein